MKFWIHHPGADNPVPLWRWALFQWSEWLYSMQCRIAWCQRRAEHRALYGKKLDDDIPF
jgi:hypothetical protein